jgi:hypothetical protein
MAAEQGNKYAAYTVEELRNFCKSFAEHIESGYSDTSFPDCDYRTIYTGLENNPDVLQSEKELIEKSKRRRMMFWEGEGMKLATGESEGNATAWIFNMKNRFPEEWKDKKEVDNSHEFRNRPDWLDAAK